MSHFSRLIGLAAICLMTASAGSALFGQKEVGVDTDPSFGHAKVASILGKSVKNKMQEPLGEIQDLVFNTDGKISYAVMSFGGFIGLGEKYFAIPWESLSADKDLAFTLGIDKDKMEKAPGFDKSKWPDMANKAWTSEIDAYHSPNNVSDRSWGGKARLLNSADIKTPSGTKFGTVQDIIVDPSNGRATLVVIHTDDKVLPNERWIAVPWSAMTVKPEDNAFILDVRDATLASAGNLGPDKWPDMGWAFTLGAYTHFGRDLPGEYSAAKAVTAAARRAERGASCRSSKAIGAVVRSNHDVILGKVEDLVFGADSGRVAFMILNTPANDGMLRAIPYRLCRFSKTGECVVTCDAELLKNAPAFAEKDWPDFGEEKCQESFLRYFGVKDDNLFSSDR